MCSSPALCGWGSAREGEPHREDVLESGLEKVPELLLRDELEEGGLERVVSGIIERLHQ